MDNGKRVKKEKSSGPSLLVKAIVFLVVAFGPHLVFLLYRLSVFLSPGESGMLDKLIPLCTDIKMIFPLMTVLMFLSALLVYLSKYVLRDKEEWLSLIKNSLLIGGLMSLLVLPAILWFLGALVKSDPPSDVYMKACML